MEELNQQSILTELLEMKKQMDKLYSRSLQQPQTMERTDKTAQERPPADWHPPVDIWETENDWIAACDLPGVAEDDLEVELVGRRLIIKGMKNDRPPVPASLKVQHRERPTGHFHRILELPAETRDNQVNAEFRQGVLLITIAKLPAEKKKIVIQAG